MINALRPALTLVLSFALLTGLLAPLAMTGIAQLLFPYQANGSIVEVRGKTVGSTLIGQAFSSDKYLLPRPSATTEPDPEKPGQVRPAPYNAAASAASQLGPTSAALLAAVRDRVAAYGTPPIPADAAYASGSGLDPDISPANALRQVSRIAAARGLPEQQVRTIVEQHIKGRLFGLLGEPRVNVLEVNLALDRPL